GFPGDWSADVCSSDLGLRAGVPPRRSPAAVSSSVRIAFLRFFAGSGHASGGAPFRGAAPPVLAVQAKPATFRPAPKRAHAIIERSEDRRVGDERRGRR